MLWRSQVVRAYCSTSVKDGHSTHIIFVRRFIFYRATEIGNLVELPIGAARSNIATRFVRTAVPSHSLTAVLNFSPA